MVTNVITVGPDTSVYEVAALLLKHGISAVPVVDAAGGICGIISEGDLINRPESGTVRPRSWWLDALASKDTLADTYVRRHSSKVSDLMTTHVISASRDTSLAQLAEILETKRIKRVPIVEDGRLVGIVSRANLLQGLARLNTDPAQPPVADDSAIRDQISKRLATERWATPALLNVTVQKGTVDLWGMVQSAAERNAVNVLAKAVPGVQKVNDNLVVRPVTAAGWV
jgi:CBS-domain-containing membrane protein